MVAKGGVSDRGVGNGVYGVREGDDRKDFGNCGRSV